jgi:hypothetical protein
MSPPTPKKELPAVPTKTNSAPSIQIKTPPPIPKKPHDDPFGTTSFPTTAFPVDFNSPSAFSFPADFSSDFSSTPAPSSPTPEVREKSNIANSFGDWKDDAFAPTKKNASGSES